MPANEPVSLRRCTHCSSQFHPRRDNERFCCVGCRLVYDLIQSEGLSNFYQLLNHGALEPPGSLPLSPVEFGEIKEEIERAESAAIRDGSPARLSLRLGNLTCTACIWLIERLFSKQKGALKLSADTNRSILTFHWAPDQFDALKFAEDLQRFGYPPGSIHPGDEADLPRESHSLLTRLGVTAALAMNAMAFTLPSYLGMDPSSELARLFLLVTLASASLAMAVGGSYFFGRAWNALRLGVLHMDVPISLGLITAYLGSLSGLIFGIEKILYFDFVAVFAFLMLLGRWVHLHLIERNRRQLWAREQDLTALFRIDPESGERQRIHPKDVRSDEIIEVPPGCLIPVDGNLISSGGSLRLDWISGEPEPSFRQSGQFIPAGARNASSHKLEIETISQFSGSLLEKLLSQENKSEADGPSNSPTDHLLLKIYLIAVITTSVVGGIGWLISGAGISKALQVFISVLVVSCPCALGLALPLVDEILLNRLKKNGVFLRNLRFWQKLNQVTRFVFDKTGTLTGPVQKLNDPETLKELGAAETLVLGALVSGNRHPVGRALYEAMVEQLGSAVLRQAKEKAINIEDIPGRGVTCKYNGKRWRLGKGEWAAKVRNESVPPDATIFSREEKPVAVFRFAESMRSGAAEQISAFQKAGFHVSVLSGDPDRNRVIKTTQALGIDSDSVVSGLSPEEKAAHIRGNFPQSSLFVGDGGNDSLAFDEALCGGSPATGVPAIESKADFVFAGRDFQALGLLLAMAKRRRHIIFAIFSVALIYNLAAAAVCLAGLMNPLLAAILMPLSSLVTTVIAARA